MEFAGNCSKHLHFGRNQLELTQMKVIRKHEWTLEQHGIDENWNFSFKNSTQSAYPAHGWTSKAFSGSPAVTRNSGQNGNSTIILKSSHLRRQPYPNHRAMWFDIQHLKTGVMLRADAVNCIFTFGVSHTTTPNIPSQPVAPPSIRQ